MRPVDYLYNFELLFAMMKLELGLRSVRSQNLVKVVTITFSFYSDSEFL